MKIDARFLVRLYPRAWRKRYGEEFVTLVGESPSGTATVINIIGGALRERWYSFGPAAESGGWPRTRAILLALLSSAVVCVIGWLANVAAMDLFARYGDLAALRMTITDGLPRVAYPAQILRSLPTFPWLPLLIMARAWLAMGASALEWRWRFRVSSIELLVWSVVFFAAATSMQLRSIISNGFPGSPFMSRYEIWESAVLTFAAAAIWLTGATPIGLRIREQILEDRRNPSPPSSILGLGA